MIGYTPCEDPEYAFAVGRVRAREARMFARSQFDRLTDSRNENQILSTLADTPYGEMHAENTDDMLSRSEAAEEAFFARYLTDEKVAGFFNAPRIASNLKWAIRKHFGAAIDEGLFITETASTPEAFERMLTGEESGLPDWIRETAGEVIAENYQDVNPASIDIIIDKASVERQYELSLGYSFLRAYLGLRVDFINLSAMLRLKIGGQDRDSFGRVFLPHGTVKKDVFKTWWDLSQESLSVNIPRTEPFGDLKDGLRGVSDDFVPLEREVQETEIDFLLSTRRLTFGYEPLVGYSVLKRVERRNIRKVITGLRYGLEPEITRRSIAWFD